MTIKILTLTIALVSVGALLFGCGSTTTTTTNNTRSNNGMTNLGSNTANVGAVVVNSNSNMASNRWSNATARVRTMTRAVADYEKAKGQARSVPAQTTVGYGSDASSFVDDERLA